MTYVSSEEKREANRRASKRYRARRRAGIVKITSTEPTSLDTIENRIRIIEWAADLVTHDPLADSISVARILISAARAAAADKSATEIAEQLSALQTEVDALKKTLGMPSHGS